MLTVLSTWLNGYYTPAIGIVSGCTWICLWTFSGILRTISGSASPRCRRHSGCLKISVGWRSSPYILPSLWGILVSRVDLLKLYLWGVTSSPGCGCKGPALGASGGLGESTLVLLSWLSSTSSIFTEGRSGGTSEGEGDGDSEWVGKLEGIGGVRGLGCGGASGKGIGAGCQDANSKSELSLYSLSALDKENSLESSLHWSTYLYIIYLVCALSVPHSQPNHVWHVMWCDLWCDIVTHPVT